MSKVPLGKYSKMLRMLFEGYSTRDIARDSDVSPPSVSNLKKDFVKTAERIGLMQAAKGYGVGKQVDDLIDLAKKVRALDGGFPSVKAGVEYGESFEKIDVEPKDVSTWVDDVYKAALDEGLKPKEVGVILRRLSEVSDESGLGFAESVKALEESTRRRSEDEEKVLGLEAEISDLEEKRVNALDTTDEALTGHALTQSQLNEYSVALTKCKAANVNFDEAVTLSNVIERMVGEKKPYAEVIAFYERNLDLNSERDEKTKEINTLNESKRELEAGVDETGKRLESDKASLRVIQTWKEAGLSPVRGTTLLGKVEEYAARNGLSREDSFERFYVDLEEHWEPLLGFANEYSRLSAKVETSKQELDNLKEALRVTRQAYDSTTTAVKAKEALNKRGVGDDMIIAWDKVLTDCGTDLVSFRGEMAKLGGVKALAESKRAEVRKAELKLSELTSKIYFEEDKYHKLRAANEAFTEHFDNVVNPYLSRIDEMMADLEAKLLDEKNGIEPRMRTIVEDATGNLSATVKGKIVEVSKEMSTLIENVKKGQGDFEKGVNSSISRVDKSIASWKSERDKSLREIYELGEMVQKYQNLRNLMKVVNGEEPDPLDFTVAFIALLDASEAYFWKKNYPSINSEIRMIKSKVLGEMRDGRLPT